MFPVKLGLPSWVRAGKELSVGRCLLGAFPSYTHFVLLLQSDMVELFKLVGEAREKKEVDAFEEMYKLEKKNGTGRLPV